MVGRNRVAGRDEPSEGGRDHDFDRGGPLLPGIPRNVPIHVAVEPLVRGEEPRAVDETPWAVLENFPAKGLELLPLGGGKRFFDRVALRRVGRAPGAFPSALGDQDDDIDAGHDVGTSVLAIALWSSPHVWLAARDSEGAIGRGRL